MTFREFLFAHCDGTLEQDAAWRAYDIPGSIRPNHVRSALKALKLSYAGEHAMAEFCARYDVTVETAPTILGSWWVWSMLDRGLAVTTIRRRARNAPG